MVADTEAVNGAVVTETLQPVVPIEIGREFIKQYYTLLAENPEAVFRFYSHESTFDHNGTEAHGQAKIQQAIESLKSEFSGSKVRIHDIKGAHSAEKSILLQVCGVLDAPGKASRSFVQAVVLVQQTEKKFFVLNDIFQYVDEALKDAASANLSASNNNEVDGEKLKSLPNGNSNTNGTASQPSPVKTPKKIEDEKVADVENLKLTPNASPNVNGAVPQSPCVERDNKVEDVEEHGEPEPPEANSAPVEPVKSPETAPTAPVSWAGKVRQGAAPMKENSRPAFVQQDAASHPHPPKEEEFVPKSNGFRGGRGGGRGSGVNQRGGGSYVPRGGGRGTYAGRGGYRGGFSTAQ